MYMPRDNKRVAGLPVAADYATYGLYVQNFPYYKTPQVPLVGLCRSFARHRGITASCRDKRAVWEFIKQDSHPR